MRDLRLVNVETGQPMAFEILLDDPNFERITLPFVKNLERLGVTARVRTVDSAQYEYRMKQFDFDMTVALFAQSSSPGNEQVDYWASVSADTPGSRNLAGIRDPAWTGSSSCSSPRRTAPPSWPARARWTACCCGGTT